MATKIIRRRSCVLVGVAIACYLTPLAGCATVGPNYTAPAIKVPSTWQAAVPHEGNTTSLLNWWQEFKDPTLDQLLRAAEADSPTLEQAAAAIATAGANRYQAAAAGSPAANTAAGATRSGAFRSNDGVSSTVATLPGSTGNASVSSARLDASWEIDLFGSVRHSKEAAARLEAREADWHDARVSLAAQLVFYSSGLCVAGEEVKCSAPPPLQPAYGRYIYVK